MKLLVLCLLPLVLAAPQDLKRFVVGSFQLDSLFDVQAVKCDIQVIIDVVGSTPTEALCEKECVKVVTDGNVLNHGCPLLCHVIQDLAKYFHETPKPGDQTQPCGGLGDLGRK